MAQLDKEAVREPFKRHATDTGSSEVQVALLTKRIAVLTEHLKDQKKDHSSRFGLIKMVNSRRRLLDYLKASNPERYNHVIKELGLRR